MKTGKRIPLVVDSKFKSHIGTVDSKNLKSLYIQFSSWVEPVSESSCWGCVVKNFKKSIKTEMSGLINLDNFKPKVIVDLDLRSSGISLSKRSFMKCEITMFTNQKLSLKDKNLVTELELKTNRLINKETTSNKHFNFYSSKTK
tara:strand:+ start:255 stop:686 length:432 start_codon:yes stop_codon:yes gene_type:complete